LSQQPGFHASFERIEGRAALIAVAQVSGIENNANPLFFAPNDPAASSEVTCRDHEIKYRGNTDLVLNLKGGTGVRHISNEAIDSRTVECD
jgi:hypothetical protein